MSNSVDFDLFFLQYGTFHLLKNNIRDTPINFIRETNLRYKT